MLNAIEPADPCQITNETHWTVRDTFTYWEAKRGQHDMPSRSSIDPTEIVDLLPNLILLDVLHDPRDFQYRLVGTNVEGFMASPRTGKRMSELQHQKPPSEIWKSCNKVVEERQPLISSIPYVGPKKDFLRVEDIILPLSPHGEQVNMLLVAVAFVRKTRLPPSFV
ncbi:MAG: PAS domain-containing protein [Pseudomonadota bacterium]